jgi:hypothetical protein
MFPVYSGKCLSRKAVHNWVDKISQGPSKVSDDARPGHLVESVSEGTVQLLEELIRADRRIMIDNVTTALGCSHGLACNIMHDRLKFREVCARWVPRQLKDRRDKMNRMCLSLKHLLRYADDGEDMLNRIATGDESWVRHYQPESKCASVQRKHPSSPSSKTLKIMPLAGSVMLTVFWNSQGVL